MGWGWEGVFAVVDVGNEINGGPVLYSIDTPSLSIIIKLNKLFVIATGAPPMFIQHMKLYLDRADNG